MQKGVVVGSPRNPLKEGFDRVSASSAAAVSGFASLPSALNAVWLAYHYQKRLLKRQVVDTDISEAVCKIVDYVTNAAASLRVTGGLLVGVTRLYEKKVEIFQTQCSDVLRRLQYEMTVTNGARLNLARTVGDLRATAPKKKGVSRLAASLASAVDGTTQWADTRDILEAPADIRDQHLLAEFDKQRAVEDALFSAITHRLGQPDPLSSLLLEKTSAESSTTHSRGGRRSRPNSGEVPHRGFLDAMLPGPALGSAADQLETHITGMADDPFNEVSMEDLGVELVSSQPRPSVAATDQSDDGPLGRTPLGIERLRREHEVPPSAKDRPLDFLLMQAASAAIAHGSEKSDPLSPVASSLPLTPAQSDSVTSGLSQLPASTALLTATPEPPPALLSHAPPPAGSSGEEVVGRGRVVMRMTARSAPCVVDQQTTIPEEAVRQWQADRSDLCRGGQTFRRPSEAWDLPCFLSDGFEDGLAPPSRIGKFLRCCSRAWDHQVSFRLERLAASVTVRREQAKRQRPGGDYDSPLMTPIRRGSRLSETQTSLRLSAMSLGSQPRHDTSGLRTNTDSIPISDVVPRSGRLSEVRAPLHYITGDTTRASTAEVEIPAIVISSPEKELYAEQSAQLWHAIHGQCGAAGSSQDRTPLKTPFIPQSRHCPPSTPFLEGQEGYRVAGGALIEVHSSRTGGETGLEILDRTPPAQHFQQRQRTSQAWDTATMRCISPDRLMRSRRLRTEVGFSLRTISILSCVIGRVFHHPTLRVDWGRVKRQAKGTVTREAAHFLPDTPLRSGSQCATEASPLSPKSPTSKEGDAVVTFGSLVAGQKRDVVAATFFEILALASRRFLDVSVAKIRPGEAQLPTSISDAELFLTVGANYSSLISDLDEAATLRMV